MNVRKLVGLAVVLTACGRSPGGSSSGTGSGGTSGHPSTSTSGTTGAGSSTSSSSTSGSGSSGSTSSGSTSGTSGTTDAGTADGGIQTFDDYANAVANAACDQLIRCNELDPALASVCPQLYVALNYGRYETQINAGTLYFNAAGEDLCVSEIASEAAASCAPLASGPDCPVTLIADAGIGANCAGGLCSEGNCEGSGCSATCTAEGGLNEPCISGVVCNDDLSCDSDTCLGPSAPGGPCNFTHSGTCDVHGYCPINGSTCVALPGTGQPCDSSNTPSCDPTVAFCDRSSGWPGTCVPLLDAGSACTSPDQCGPDAYCDASGTCQVASGDGGPCASITECASSFRCIQGTCTPPHGDGGACIGYGDCQTNLVCDQVSRVCMPGRPATYVDPGQPCDNAGIWCRGSWCKDAIINPDGGIGAFGTCIAGTAGDPCRSGGECYHGTYCDYLPDGGADAGTCQQSFEGASCVGPQNCLAGQYCPSSGSPRTCRHLGDAGESCEATDFAECQDGLACKTDGGSGSVGTCGVPGAAGDPCVGGGSGQCRYPDQCFGGACVLQGVAGAGCTPYQSCIWGWCNTGDTDAGPSGTCESPLSNGQACTGDSQCASGICINNLCADACF